MNCPKCGNICKEGFIQVRTAGSITNALTMATWYPIENKGKIIKKDYVDLSQNAEACYCEQCMKVYAVFEEK